MFSFSAENTKCNITVGYISSERGFVDGVGVYEAIILLSLIQELNLFLEIEIL